MGQQVSHSRVKLRNPSYTGGRSILSLKSTAESSKVQNRDISSLLTKSNILQKMSKKTTKLTQLPDKLHTLASLEPSLCMFEGCTLFRFWFCLVLTHTNSSSSFPQRSVETVDGLKATRDEMLRLLLLRALKSPFNMTYRSGKRKFELTYAL